MDLKLLSNKLAVLYPVAKPGLHSESDFQFLIAVMLSPQSSDERVNQVSKKLFAVFPNSKLLSVAIKEEVVEILKPLGLQNVKAQNIITAAKAIELLKEVPSDFQTLSAIPGIGEKCAKLYLGEKHGFHYFPIDRHIERIFHRIYENDYADKLLLVEQEVEDVMMFHYRLIKFGRYYCKAYNPECLKCPVQLTCNHAINKYHKYIH